MNPRVFGAIIAGLILVVAAYTHTRAVSDESAVSGTLAVADRNAPPRMYIPTDDRDNDGVPDWQQALRTTEPLEIEPLASTTYEVPDTLTDQFAIELFNDIIKSKSYGQFGQTPDEIIAQASDELVQKAADEFYTLNDITPTRASSTDALRAYANAVAQIALDFGIPTATRNEVLILEEAVAKGNEEVLSELVVIRESYSGMREAMLALPVPLPLVQQHLNLINAYAAIENDVRAFEAAFSDPLLALLRLKRYQDDATGLGLAFASVFNAVSAAGVVFTPGIDSTLKVVQFGPPPQYENAR